MSDYITEELVEQSALSVHRWMCEDSWDDDCRPYEGRCVRAAGIALDAAVPAIVQAAKVEALRDAAADIDLEDAAKASDLNDLDYYWTGHYWESVAEEWLRARAGKAERGES